MWKPLTYDKSVYIHFILHRELEICVQNAVYTVCQNWKQANRLAWAYSFEGIRSLAETKEDGLRGKNICMVKQARRIL